MAFRTVASREQFPRARAIILDFILGIIVMVVVAAAAAAFVITVLLVL